MGVFDYERLKNNIKDFSYNLFNYPTDFSKDYVLENSYDGIVYEKRTTNIITGYDGSNNPQYREVNKFNPIVDLKTVTEEQAKEILNEIVDTTQFAYRVKPIGDTTTSTDSNISEYFKLVKNTKFFLPIARSFKKTFPACVFNKYIFNITKLREEIFFINVTVKQTGKPKFNTILAVNDYSFWKRFDIKYIDESNNDTSYIPMRQKDFNNNSIPLIDECINNPSKYLIKMRYIYDEEDRQKNYFKNSNRNADDEYADDPESNPKFINPELTVIEFTGLTHYNKRTWVSILTKGNTGMTYEDISDDPEIGSFKTEDSNTFYPGDESELCMTYR